MFKSTGILDNIELQPLFRQEFASFLIYTNNYYHDDNRDSQYAPIIIRKSSSSNCT